MSRKKRKIDSRSKGARFERRIGKEFREWMLPAFKKNEDPTAFFIRSPGSGSWDRRHCPGEDLIVPDWFPYSIELKHRENWTLSKTLRGEGEVWSWWDDTVGKAANRPILIFTKNYETEWVLLEKDLYTSLPRTRKRVLRIDISLPSRGNYVLMPLDAFFSKIDPKALRKKNVR